MTLGEALKNGALRLKNAGIEEYDNDAWLLLSCVTGVSRAYYYAHSEDGISEEQAEAYLQHIDMRASRVPLQHITHQAYFMGYEFYVDESVLIPRQDTEVLVEECLKALKDVPSPRILDMCTGSGCIITSLLLERPDATGTGADVSLSALRTAKKNAEALGTLERCEFVPGNLFSAPYFDEIGRHEALKYDILVSNPPYIRTEVIGTLAEEVRVHDPGIALDGGADGLDFYRKITEAAARYLKKGGRILYEIGYDQAEDLRKILSHGGFENIRIVKDLSGLDRVAAAELPKAQTDTEL